MALDPVRMIRRWRSFRAEVTEEVGFLIERHGADARKVAEQRLASKAVGRDEKRLLTAALRRLNG